MCSWLQQFLMRQMVSIPADESTIGIVFKKRFHCRRFNMAIAKDNVRLGQVGGFGWSRITKPCVRVVPPQQVLSGKRLGAVAMKAVADCHHFTGIDDFRRLHGRLDDGWLTSLYH